MNTNSCFSKILELIEVSKYYGYGLLGSTKFPAVEKISLDIPSEPPKVITIAGESGSGKSTLAKIMLGLIKPDEGQVLYRGKNIWKYRRTIWKHFRRDVQAIFQDPFDSFNPYEKVGNYLIKSAKNMANINDELELRRRIEHALQLVGLEFEVLYRKPRQLSGGQLQRLAIARALITGPKLIIADEPVSMIDVSLRINILNVLKDLKEKEKISLVYITHDLSTAYYISDELMIMYRGVLIEKGSIDELLKEPLHPYTITLLESLPDRSKRAEWLKQEDIVSGMKHIRYTYTTEIAEFLIKGCKYIFHCPLAMDICKVRRPPLIKIKPDHYVACWHYNKNI